MKKSLKQFSAAVLLVFAAACSSPEERIEKHYASGVEYLDEGDLGRANVEFQNVLKIDEEHVPTLVGLVRIAEERKDFRAMFGTLQKIIRLDPENIGSLAKLGKIHLIASEESEAMEMADRALAIDPDYIDAMTLKAAVLLRVGDKNSALELARKVIEREPENAEAAVILASSKAQDGDIEGAIAEIDRSLALDPERAVLQLLRIRLLAQLERTDDVMAAYEELTRIFPDEPVYLRTYAAALIGKKDFGEALVQLREVVELTPDDLDAKLDVVRVVNASEGPQAAEEQLRSYVRDNPENEDLKFALTDFLLQERDVDAAISVVQPLTGDKDDAKSLRAKNKLANIYLRNDRLDDARSLTDEILAADENNSDALLRRAQFQISADQVDNAIANLRTVLSNDPDSYQAMMLMASAFERQGNRDFARSELSKALKASNDDARVANIFARFLIAENSVQRAAEVLEQSLAANPESTPNLELLARARLNLEDWRGAEEIAGILENMDQGGTNNDAALNIRTFALSGLEEYDQVIDLLERQQAENEPLAASPLAALIRAYLVSERSDEAVATLEGVIASEPENYEARLLMARVLLLSEGPTERITSTLRQAIDIDAERPEAYVALYNIYRRNSDDAAARAAVDSGLSRIPDSNALRIYKADMVLADGEKEAALALYSDLVEELPNNLVVVNNFISLSSDLEPDQKEASERLQYLSALEGQDNPFFQDTIGWAHYRAGNYDRAVEALSRAAGGAGGNAEILYHYGAAKVAAGDVEGGRETLREALEVGGDQFEFADQVNAILQQ